MTKIIIIGGGASGLIAAIQASSPNNQVTLIDKNNSYGKKILITGNGKCNYWNEDISINHYNTQNKEILAQIITEKTKHNIMNFFNNIGIIPKIKDGYYYPASNQSTNIQTSLILEAKLNHVKMLTNEEVLSVARKDNNFFITTTTQKLKADKIILATGGMACPKTGSDGFGYTIAKHFGHSIIPLLPSLVQLKGEETYFKEWHGIRTDVKVSLYENNHLLKTSTGEIQLTNYGVSGICIFQLSGLISRGLFNQNQEQIKINFLDYLSISSEQSFIEFMNKRNNQVKKRTISELLDGLLNYKLINLILKLSKINKEENWNNLTFEQKHKLSKNLTQFTLNITGTNSFDQAQVTTGGIPLSEINPNTMESLKQKDLYIVGELLDVDGECGGFNLGFAWISGYIAGTSMKGE